MKINFKLLESSGIHAEWDEEDFITRSFIKNGYFRVRFINFDGHLNKPNSLYASNSQILLTDADRMNEIDRHRSLLREAITF